MPVHAEDGHLSDPGAEVRQAHVDLRACKHRPVGVEDEVHVREALGRVIHIGELAVQEFPHLRHRARLQHRCGTNDAVDIVERACLNHEIVPVGAHFKRQDEITRLRVQRHRPARLEDLALPQVEGDLLLLIVPLGLVVKEHPVAPVPAPSSVEADQPALASAPRNRRQVHDDGSLVDQVIRRPERQRDHGRLPRCWWVKVHSEVLPLEPSVDKRTALDGLLPDAYDGLQGSGRLDAVRRIVHDRGGGQP
mmetsp:Transcript_73562/g.157669  ORF Transcript_73562/g.157669 Transcript_73562/m.157669 type:complete len:250 (+) Transcript_73562:3351-4100(+)